MTDAGFHTVKARTGELSRTVSTCQIQPDLGHYLAGLVDGEGCFFITSNSNGGYRCGFIIHMRADDKPLLERMRAEVGLGLLHLGRRAAQADGNPSVQWHIETIGDCRTLVSIFETYPLRSKKARDFELWRDAVLAWSARDWRWMEQLRNVLMASRAYRDIEEEIPEPPTKEQLALEMP